MRPVALGVLLLAASFGSLELAAQTKPDFSGVWVSVGTKVSPDLTIKHTGSTLAFNRGPNQKASLNLNGRETRVSMDGKPMIAKAIWQGNTVVVALYDIDGAHTPVKHQTWAVDSNGQLVIDTSGAQQGPERETFKRR